MNESHPDLSVFAGQSLSFKKFSEELKYDSQKSAERELWKDLGLNDEARGGIVDSSNGDKSPVSPTFTETKITGNPSREVSIGKSIVEDALNPWSVDENVPDPAELPRFNSAAATKNKSIGNLEGSKDSKKPKLQEEDVDSSYNLASQEVEPDVILITTATTKVKNNYQPLESGEHSGSVVHIQDIQQSESGMQFQGTQHLGLGSGVSILDTQHSGSDVHVQDTQHSGSFMPIQDTRHSESAVHSKDTEHMQKKSEDVIMVPSSPESIEGENGLSDKSTSNMLQQKAESVSQVVKEKLTKCIKEKNSSEEEQTPDQTEEPDQEYIDKREKQKENNRRYAKESRNRKTQQLQTLMQENKEKEAVIEIYKKCLTLYHLNIRGSDPCWEKKSMEWHPGQKARNQESMKIDCFLPVDPLINGIGNSPYGSILGQSVSEQKEQDIKDDEPVLFNGQSQDNTNHQARKPSSGPLDRTPVTGFRIKQDPTGEMNIKETVYSEKKFSAQNYAHQTPIYFPTKDGKTRVCSSSHPGMRIIDPMSSSKHFYASSLAGSYLSDVNVQLLSNVEDPEPYNAHTEDARDIRFNDLTSSDALENSVKTRIVQNFEPPVLQDSLDEGNPSNLPSVDSPSGFVGIDELEPTLNP